MISRRVVVFDFDGTLTWVDSFPVLLAWTLAFRPWRTALAVLAVPALYRFAIGRGSAAAAKEALLRMAVGGMAEGRAQTIAAAFVQRVVPLLERRSLVQRLMAHRDGGDAVWIVSASPELICGALAARWGIEGAIGTRLEVVGGRLTGRLAGQNCAGEEKVTRLRAVLGERIDRVAIVYADDPGRDGRLWALARVAVRVPGPLPALASLHRPVDR